MIAQFPNIPNLTKFPIVRLYVMQSIGEASPQCLHTMSVVYGWLRGDISLTLNITLILYLMNLRSLRNLGKGL